MIRKKIHLRKFKYKKKKTCLVIYCLATQQKYQSDSITTTQSIQGGVCEVGYQPLKTNLIISISPEGHLVNKFKKKFTQI